MGSAVCASVFLTKARRTSPTEQSLLGYPCHISQEALEQNTTHMYSGAASGGPLLGPKRDWLLVGDVIKDDGGTGHRLQQNNAEIAEHARVCFADNSGNQVRGDLIIENNSKKRKGRTDLVHYQHNHFFFTKVRFGK